MTPLGNSPGGIERRQIGGLTLLLFPAGMLGVEAEMISDRNAAPHDYSWAVARPGVNAVLDGPMFADCNGSSPPSESYSTYQCGTIQYALYDAARGVSISSRYPSRGLSIGVTADGNAVSAPGGYPPPGAVASVQTYPTLLRGGSIEASQSIDTDITWRAAVCIMNDGRLAFAVARMSMYGFAQALRNAGAVTAGYTDGGGSAALYGGGAYSGSSEHRRVPAFVVARGNGSMWSASPGVSTLVLGAGVLAASWWLYKRFV